MVLEWMNFPLHFLLHAQMSACLQVYTDVKQLRYGHLMIMTDQDHDGSHIKGLIMNYFHTFYPSLMKLAGFLIEFITPVIKVDVISASHSSSNAVPSDRPVLQSDRHLNFVRCICGAARLRHVLQHRS